MQCQKKAFSLPEGVHYLNCAYKAPLLQAAEAACHQALLKERNPIQITVDDFFDPVDDVRKEFAQLVHAQPKQIAVIPSTSYGFASVLINIQPKPGGHALTIEDEFPSGYFALQRWCADNANALVVVPAEQEEMLGRGWNAAIIDSITEHTSVVLLSSVHWMRGMQFDLEAIGRKCREVGAYFIVDGTQSVGVAPIHVVQCQIDALVCAAYKWLLGPYSLALAYIGPAFYDGKPLEETWINRNNSYNFAALTQYDTTYTPQAGRFNMGEVSNFILLPMLRESLRFLNYWQPERIETYCKRLGAPLLSYLKEIGITQEEPDYASSHLIAIRLPDSIDSGALKQKLLESKVYLSVRGAYIRVGIHVFNEEKDIDALIAVLKNVLIDKES